MLRPGADAAEKECVEQHGEASAHPGQTTTETGKRSAEREDNRRTKSLCQKA
jgi:hypothetical protein